MKNRLKIETKATPKPQIIEIVVQTKIGLK